MSNSKLYQPPPPPPKKAPAPVDPLVALSKAPTVIAEELTDLTDDEGLEEWAKGGTRIIPKPEPQPASQQHPSTMMAGPLPSFHPVAYSMAPPRITEKRTSAAIWLVPLALFILAGGVVAAAAAYYVYHTSEAAALAAASEIATTATETAPPAVTLTATSTPAPTVTATVTPTPTSTSVSITSTNARRAPTASTTNTTGTTTTGTTASTGSGAGSLRTFAAGNGKPVYVDGRLVGYGGAKMTSVCGRHLVGVGTGHARSVDIPCNGATITVGSPDGT